jgi:hypothetical protein
MRGSKPGEHRGGRKKGTPNKNTREIKALATRLLSDKTYLTMLQGKLNTGEIPPAIWQTLYHYAYGKPTEMVELNGELRSSVTLVFQTREK